MKRLVWLSGEPDTPGHDYRVLRFVAAAQAAGLEAVWLRAEEVSARIGEIAAADVLFIWRAAWDERIAAAVEAARSRGVKIVFDLDDLMLDPDLARRDIIDGIRTMNLTEAEVRDYYTRVLTTLSAADLCLATTAELADHMRRAGKPTLVIPNGFDERIRAASSLAVRRRAAAADDGLIRIGYAAGTRTHQRDFAVCADAVAELLRSRPAARLVLFRSAAHRLNCLDPEEFPSLADLEDRIEWRDVVPVDRLPEELARLDVNLAPLEVGNPFCEAKSELKFFEAALAGVPTVASPTGPYRRAVRHGETGFFAASREEWRDALARLLDDPGLRRRIAAAARREALWRFGPERRMHLLLGVLDLLAGGRAVAGGFEAVIRERLAPPAPAPTIPEHRILFEADRFGTAEVTVVVPLYNYAHTIEEALDSVREQRLEALDLVVVDDRSQDNSAEVAVAWARRHAARFNRIVVARNAANEGLGAARNLGFELAETAWVFPLDADNRLTPECVAACRRAIEGAGAAFAYPQIRYFGDGERQIALTGWDPVRLANGNYIDAMALISRAAWAAAGGYDTVRSGWEDFDLWCRLAELGLWGVPVPGPALAEYRLHNRSMIRGAMAEPERVRWMMRRMSERHPWLTMISPIPEAKTLPPPEPSRLSPQAAADRELEIQEIDVVSKPQRLEELDEVAYLTANPDVKAAGISAAQHFLEYGLADRREQWQGLGAVAYLRDRKLATLAFRREPVIPRKSGEAAHFITDSAIREFEIPAIDMPVSSNVYTTDITELIRANPDKRFLDLGAGLRPTYYRNVVTTDIYDAVTTDVVCIGEDMPFADDQFDYVLAFAVLEHTRRPWDVAKEICRIVKPGGRIIIDYPFLQPLHGYPHHFFNATAGGNASLFRDACDILSLTVPLHLWPIYSLSWILALWKNGLPAEDADAFGRMTVDQLTAPPHEQSGRPYCTNLPEEARQSIAAGSRLIAMKRGRRN